MGDKERNEFIERSQRVESAVRESMATYKEASKTHNTAGSSGWVNEQKTTARQAEKDKLEFA